VRKFLNLLWLDNSRARQLVCELRFNGAFVELRRFEPQKQKGGPKSALWRI
jgi:hypothetical protein